MLLSGSLAVSKNFGFFPDSDDTDTTQVVGSLSTLLRTFIGAMEVDGNISLPVKYYTCSLRVPGHVGRGTIATPSSAVLYFYGGQLSPREMRPRRDSPHFAPV